MSWIVHVEWSNSSPTYVGPFDDIDAAERYASANVDNEPGVTQYWTMSLSSPLFTADGWRVTS